MKMKLDNFFIDIVISTLLHTMVGKLCDFKVLKMGENLHANKEGFCRDRHIITVSL